MHPQRHWSQRIAVPCCLWTSAWLFVCSAASLATEDWWWLPLVPLALCLLSLCVVGRPSVYAKPMAIVWPIASIGIVAWEIVDEASIWPGALVAGLVLAAAVFGISASGRAFWRFMLDSRIELRKVVWPTRQETFQMTAVVFGFLAVAGLFFWVLDLFLAWATKMLTGQGG